MKLQEKIDKLIPYIGDEFLCYPLWEEGYWFPTIKMWTTKSDETLQAFEQIVDKYPNYELEYDCPFYTFCSGISDDITTVFISIVPRTEYITDEESSCELLRAVSDYSIEEMVNILVEFVELINIGK